MATHRRLDLGELRPMTRRGDGTVRVQAHLTRCGVFPYLQPDGTIRRELRPRDEVMDPESLASFAGVPVTNDHPPEMVDSKNARKYAVGSLQGTPIPDDDHVRGDLSVYDGETIGQMDSGSRRQVSLGYTCDLEETPGVDPVYGPYDAIQRNIRGNHVALVTTARAGGTARVRLDAAEQLDGTVLALCTNCAKMHFMATNAAHADASETDKPQGGKPEAGDPDTGDEASRNAAGANDAQAGDKAKKPPATADDTDTKVERDSADDDEEDDTPTDGGDDDDTSDDDDDEGDDSDDDTDAGDDDEEDRDDDGEQLSDEDRHKMATSSFAVPDREGLPIHDPDHTRAAMARFNQYKFKSPEEKHAAFNRITRRASHFGIDSKGFEEAHRDRLDREDDEMKKIAQLQTKLDAAEKKLATAEGQVASLTKDLEAAKKTTESARKDAADRFDAMVAERVALLTEAAATGAKVDAKMSSIEIKRTVVKHVDGEDIPAEKPEPYVDAYYEGALKRARRDAEDTKKGADALAAARATAAGATQPVPQPVPHNDADDTDEQAAYARANARNAEAWTHSWGRTQENK
jgi:hypothetical protein